MIRIIRHDELTIRRSQAARLEENISSELSSFYCFFPLSTEQSGKVADYEPNDGTFRCKPKRRCYYTLVTE